MAKAQEPPEAPAPIAAAAPAQSRNFFGRLREFYREDWTGTTPASPGSASQGPALAAIVAAVPKLGLVLWRLTHRR